MLKVEYLDARLGRREDAVVLVRTSHLALKAPGALLGVDVKAFLHDAGSPAFVRWAWHG